MPDFEDLRAAIDAEAPASSNAMTSAVAALSVRYRVSHGRAGRPVVRSPAEVDAYAVSRLPATFAALRATLRQVRLGMSDWNPTTLLDAGAGPGAATWAAVSVWPGIADITCLEAEAAMIDLGRRLAVHAPYAAIRDATWTRTNLDRADLPDASDLVVVSYVLGEVADTERAGVIARLWEHTTGVLVLVEPGTPAGFGIILEARDQMRRAGADIVAPCPHAGTCPMAGNDWCHFAQRLPRSQQHRRGKGGVLSYEDEKFSYLAMTRMQGMPAPTRIVRHPQVRSGHVRLQLCAPGGLREEVVSRRDRQRFRRARDSHWGDAFDSDDP